MHTFDPHTDLRFPDSVAYNFGVNWLAYEADEPDICSGGFHSGVYSCNSISSSVVPYTSPMKAKPRYMLPVFRRIGYQHRTGVLQPVAPFQNARDPAELLDTHLVACYIAIR